MLDPLQDANDWFHNLPEDIKRDIAYSAYSLRIFSCIRVGDTVLGEPYRAFEEKATPSIKEEIQSALEDKDLSFEDKMQAALEDMDLLFSEKDLDLITYLQRIYIFKGYVSMYFSDKSTYFDWEETAISVESFKRHLIETNQKTEFYDKHFVHGLGEKAQKWIPVAESWSELLDGTLSHKSLKKFMSDAFNAAGSKLANSAEG